MAKKTVKRIPRPRLTKAERCRNKTLGKLFLLQNCLVRSYRLAGQLREELDKLSSLITEQAEKDLNRS